MFIYGARVHKPSPYFRNLTRVKNKVLSGFCSTPTDKLLSWKWLSLKARGPWQFSKVIQIKWIATSHFHCVKKYTPLHVLSWDGFYFCYTKLFKLFCVPEETKQQIAITIQLKVAFKMILIWKKCKPILTIWQRTLWRHTFNCSPVTQVIVPQQLIHHVLHPNEPARHCFVNEWSVWPGKAKMQNVAGQTEVYRDPE